MKPKVGDAVYYPFAGRVIEKRVSKYIEILKNPNALISGIALSLATMKRLMKKMSAKPYFSLGKKLRMH